MSRRRKTFYYSYLIFWSERVSPETMVFFSGSVSVYERLPGLNWGAISPLSLQLYKWLCVLSFSQFPLGTARWPPWSSQPTQTTTEDRDHNTRPHPGTLQLEGLIEKWPNSLTHFNKCANRAPDSIERHLWFFFLLFLLIHRRPNVLDSGKNPRGHPSRAAPRDIWRGDLQGVELSLLETMHWSQRCRTALVLGYQAGRFRSPSTNLINFLLKRAIQLIETFTEKFGSYYQLTALTVSIVFFPVK